MTIGVFSESDHQQKIILTLESIFNQGAIEFFISPIWCIQ
ncbi:unnamed protein product [Paramecium octaurelia]|uniref:Uncharacterized protein n=1 Tax=Paramecium octaurelia TaxID=43137 RepID=A0A8S1VTJ7_PAROT|nr:unnamed protein product [Paramecium octaurelia]